MIKKILLASCFLLLCSCWGGLGRRPVIKHPDGSMQILEFRNAYFGPPQIKVAVYSKSKNKMIVKGWVDADKYVEWTLTKYDWQEKILERSE